MSELARVHLSKSAPDVYKALAAFSKTVGGVADEAGIDARLKELVQIHVSQLNGCAFCVDKHTAEARVVGISEQKLYGVTVWRETPFFTPRERTALAWTEAVTALGDHGVSDALHAAALEQFTELELVNLTMAVIAINSWNRLAVTFRAEVGGYQVKGH